MFLHDTAQAIAMAPFNPKGNWMSETTKKDKARSTAHKITGEGESFAEAAVERAGELAHSAKVTVLGNVRHTASHIRKLAKRTEKNLAATGKNLTKQINHNPVRTSLLAFGAGFILAMLWSRRR
jgi:hypothetical protein